MSEDVRLFVDKHVLILLFSCQLKLLDEGFKGLYRGLESHVKGRFCVDEISNLEEVLNEPIIVKGCQIAPSIQMSIQRPHDILHVILGYNL